MQSSKIKTSKPVYTIPEKQIHTSPLGRTYYLSGIDAENDKAILRYTDGACEFIRIPFKQYTNQTNGMSESWK